MQFPATPLIRALLCPRGHCQRRKQRDEEKGNHAQESSLDLEESGDGKNSPRAAGCSSVSVVGLQQVWSTVQVS